MRRKATTLFPLCDGIKTHTHTPSNGRLVVKDLCFQTPQAALQVGAGLRLQGLGELHVVRSVDLGLLLLDGVLNGLRGEVVNNGVEAAVGHGDAEGDRVDGANHRLHGAARQGLGADQSVKNQVDVVGDEAEAEDGEVHDDHAQDLPFVELPPPADGLGPAQGLQHHDGAADVEQERDDETHRLDEDHHLGQVGLPLVGGEVLEAEGGVGFAAVARCGLEQEARGEATRQHQHPHGDAHDPRVALGPQGPRAERVHDGQEAVHADAGEEEHAAVHVGVEERDGELAEDAPERPVLVDEVEDPQGQGEDEEQVGHDQVHHVGRGLVPQLQRAGEDVNGHHVGDQAHHEDHAEDRAVQRVLEAVVLGAGGVVFRPGQREVVSGDGAVVHSETGSVAGGVFPYSFIVEVLARLVLQEWKEILDLSLLEHSVILYNTAC